MSVVVELYTESTPNPETLKFVTNQAILPNFQLDFRTPESAKESPLAKHLFESPDVQSVFIAQNFVTLTKKPDLDWFEITPGLKERLRAFFQLELPAVNEVLLPKDLLTKTETEATTPEQKIIDLLEKYVKPAVEGDGGHIAFRRFEEGIVHLSMQGSCSGCPSSQITLKSGIEGLLKRMVPEVKEVVAVEE